jgi:hypothetical protein
LLLLLLQTSFCATLLNCKCITKVEELNMRAKTTTVGLAVVAVVASMVAALAQGFPGQPEWAQRAFCSGGWACMRSMIDNWSGPSMVGQLISNEGIFVDPKEFTINKGMAKGDPSEQIAKSGAREVLEGAIIFRSGAKLYIVDGRPPQ